jgi:CheY-like chemotaxis protein
MPTVNLVSNIGPLRVLLVEDSEDILFIMKTELEWAGLQTETASNGQRGLELAEQWLPDVIVSDIHMPGLDGMEFVQKARQIPGLADVPAIALTGTTEEKARQEFLAVGFNAIATKPVDPADLHALIYKVAQKSKTRGAA